MRTLTFYYLLFVLCFSGYAQYPGGVSGNLRGWFKGNAGVAFTGGAVSTWSDQSGNGFHATQATATRRPAQNTTGFNYNPTLSFDGQDNSLTLADLMASTATGVSAFAVARQTATTEDTWGCVILGQANGPAWTGGGYGLTALNAGNTSFGFWVRDYSLYDVSKATTFSTPGLMSGVWNGISANNVLYFHDGISQGNTAYTPGSVGDNGNTYIGTGYGSGTQYCFYGDIAEIAVYNTGLSTANVDKINSYLAIKYGITLPTNYLSSSGAIIYSPTTTYTNNIIGIGRDDNSALLQKQSRNYNDSVRIYMSTLATTNTLNTGAFTNTLSYVVMGATNSRLSGTNTEKPATIFSRLAREWKVTNTNFPSTFNIDMKLTSNAVLGSVSVADLRLLVDDDGDFSNATVYAAGSGLSFSYTNPMISVTGISTVMIAPGTTSYITIASAAGTTPLPIELLNFKAEACGNFVCLDWQTAIEKDNDHFILERSYNGLEWEYVAKIGATGNSLRETSYSYTDNRPDNNTQAYYQLKAYNLKGVSDYSKIVSVDLSEKQQSVQIYPNPADAYVLLEGVRPDGTISVFNSMGVNISASVNMVELPNGKLKLSTSMLSEGVYYLMLENTHWPEDMIKLIVIHN